MSFDAYLYFKGGKLNIDGEALDSEMSSKKAFLLTEFSFGAKNGTTIGSGTSGAGAGKTEFNEFTCSKYTDSASCGLFKGLSTGHHFPDAVLELRRSGGSTTKSGKTFFMIKFKLVVLTSVTWTGSENDEQMTESLEFKYGAMQMNYWLQKADGTLTKPSGTGAEAEWSQQLAEAKFAVKDAN